MRICVSIPLVFLLFAGAVTSAEQQAMAAEVGAPAAQIPRFEHVFVVVEENESYDEVIGNTKDLPYLNSLAAKYGLATNYYANTHPSINNYFYLTAGRKGTRWPWVGELSDLFSGEVAGDNVASVLSANGKTWRAYAESLPSAGYLGSNRSRYAKRHNPFAYFESVRQDKGSAGHASQAANIVPFENFAGDLKNSRFPDYSFIVPNLYDDGHTDPATQRNATCGDHHALQNIDTWLKTNMEPLIESDSFQRGGLLVIVFDEGCEDGATADWRFDPNRPVIKGGGHIPALIISGRTAGARGDGLYHHESVLRLSLRALGVEQLPGGAKDAPDMDVFFNAKGRNSR